MKIDQNACVASLVGMTLVIKFNEDIIPGKVSLDRAFTQGNIGHGMGYLSYRSIPGGVLSVDWLRVQISQFLKKLNDSLMSVEIFSIFIGVTPMPGR